MQLFIPALLLLSLTLPAQNTSPTIEWAKCYGGSGNEYAFSIQQTTNSGYIVAGYTTLNDGEVSGNHGNYDYWLLKLDAGGNTIWTKCYGGSNDDYATSIQQTTDGGYIVVGGLYSTDGDISDNHGHMDYWIVKLNPDTVTGITPVITGNDCRIFPNPSTGSFTVTGKDIQSIRMTDTNGKTVRLLGRNEIKTVNRISLGDKAKGIYFMKVITGNRTVVQKVVVE